MEKTVGIEKRKVHLEAFFTKDNAEEGVWFEPKINGIGCGFEFLVQGALTSASMADDEHFEKLYAEADAVADPITKFDEKQKVDARRVARLVKGIRAADGCDVDFNGGAVEFSVPLIEEIFYKSPIIKNEVADFAKVQTNFIKREKNN